MQPWWIAALAASAAVAATMGVAAHLLRRSAVDLERSLQHLEAARALATAAPAEGS